MSFRRSTPIEVRVARFPRRHDGLVAVRIIGLSQTAGYQCDYRGTREQAIAAIEHALATLKAMRGEATETVSEALPAGNLTGNAEA